MVNSPPDDNILETPASVSPILRSSKSRTHSRSAPPTPRIKAVQFDNVQLENVRHFFRTDRPISISTFTDSSSSNEAPPYPGLLSIVLPNFPDDNQARRSQPVRLEEMRLDQEGGLLWGSVAVANLGYHKAVTCRFTWDDWITVSETDAVYTAHLRTTHTPFKYDCFSFHIDITSRANLTNATLRCCVRYRVHDDSFWDNNNGANFDVLFRQSEGFQPDGLSLYSPWATKNTGTRRPGHAARSWSFDSSSLTTLRPDSLNDDEEVSEARQRFSTQSTALANSKSPRHLFYAQYSLNKSLKNEIASHREP